MLGLKFPWIGDLLRATDVTSGAKGLYMTACLEPFSIRELARVARLSRTTVKTHLKTLSDLGWIVLRRKGKRILVLPTAPDPIQRKHAGLLKVRLSMVFFRGEAQMKLILDILVVSRNFVENARPDFLKSPMTEFRLEVDRLYVDVVGFEYDGSQHQRPAAKFGGQPKYDKTRVNDLIKAGLATEANIQLIRVVKSDLTIEGIQSLVPASMKTWPLVEGPYLQAVRETCADYMKMDTGDEDRMRLARRETNPT